MKNNSSSNDATVCVNKNCMTVHGETAMVVNFISIVVVVIIAITAAVVMIKHLR
jgi:hypothetical protein